MKDEIYKICVGFRRGILGNRSSDQMCYAVCAPLAGYLSAMGYEVELIEGDFGRTNHFWLKLKDGRIVDPTADQFARPSGTKMPKVYIGPKPEWYHKSRLARSRDGEVLADRLREAGHAKPRP